MAELRAALAEVVAGARAAAERAVADETQALRGDMRREAPFDEGELHDSIVSRSGGLKGEVRATARHAGFVEHGTSSAPAQPYAGPAADRARRRFASRVADAVRRAVK